MSLRTFLVVIAVVATSTPLKGQVDAAPFDFNGLFVGMTMKQLRALASAHGLHEDRPGHFVAGTKRAATPLVFLATPDESALPVESIATISFADWLAIEPRRNHTDTTTIRSITLNGPAFAQKDTTEFKEWMEQGFQQLRERLGEATKVEPFQYSGGMIVRSGGFGPDGTFTSYQTVYSWSRAGEDISLGVYLTTRKKVDVYRITLTLRSTR